MGELFRSQPMSLVQLVIPFDVAHDTVDELGKLGVVQFKDVRRRERKAKRERIYNYELNLFIFFN
jgi:hypothetical protein